MRELKDIPNQEGYEFTGICKDGSKIPCSLIDDLKCYEKLKGWEIK